MKEIKVPVLPESITEATVAAWHKKPGDYVELDDVIVEIETDKVVLEVPAEESGVLSEISAEEGETVSELQVLGLIDDEAGSEDTKPSETAEKVDEKGKADSASQSNVSEESQVEELKAEEEVKEAPQVNAQAAPEPTLLLNPFHQSQWAIVWRRGFR